MFGRDDHTDHEAWEFRAAWRALTNDHGIGRWGCSASVKTFRQWCDSGKPKPITRFIIRTVAPLLPRLDGAKTWEEFGL